MTIFLVAGIRTGCFVQSLRMAGRRFRLGPHCRSPRHLRLLLRRKSMQLRLMGRHQRFMPLRGHLFLCRHLLLTMDVGDHLLLRCGLLPRPAGLLFRSLAGQGLLLGRCSRCQLLLTRGCGLL